MNTRIIGEEPLVVLRGDSYNGGRDHPVTKKMLEAASVGDMFVADSNNCGRGETLQSLKVVYRDASGCGALLQTIRSTDEANPHQSEELELIWFSWA